MSLLYGKSITKVIKIVGKIINRYIFNRILLTQGTIGIMLQHTYAYNNNIHVLQLTTYNYIYNVSRRLINEMFIIWI